MFYIGLDLGQRRDHSAIAIVEKIEVRQAYQATMFGSLHVRHVERLALGTPYPEVVERVRQITERGGEWGLAVDATGVGAPVVEMLRAARLPCEIAAVTMTSGGRESNQGNNWHVPKQDLMGGVQVMLERGELRIAAQMKNLGALLRELADVRMVWRGTSGVKIGAEGYREHDDLVVALALAVWRARRKGWGMGTQRLV